MADLIGQHLGQYHIQARLGVGGMATVYRAHQESIRRDVAIKVIETHLAQNPDFVTRFEREAHTSASLSHMHILKVFDYGQQGEIVYLVMELLPGGSLADLIKVGPLPLERVIRLTEQIAGALDYAHNKGVVHRDLKPQNVLMDGSGNAFLTDFGIAKLMQSGGKTLTQTGQVMGTPAYMAPEQWRGKNLDASCDIYALGVMLFEMLTGQLPFNADTPFALMHQHIYEPATPIRSLRADLPAGVQMVIDRALAKDPADRFRSAGEMVAALRVAISNPTPPELEQARTTHTGASLQAARRRVPNQMPNRRLAGALVIGLLAVIGVVGLLIVLTSGGNTSPTATLTSTVAAAAQESSDTPAPRLTSALPLAAVASPTVTLTGTPTPTPTTTPPSTATLAPSLTATLTSTPTVTGPSATPTSNLETLVAAALTQRAIKTALVIASFTKTPTATPTQTADFQQTIEAIVAATSTEVARRYVTPTPLPPTQTPLPTRTPKPRATLRPTATPPPVVRTTRPVAARPADTADFRRYKSIWFDLAFQDITRPGSVTYRTSITSDSVRAFSLKWCGDTVNRMVQIVEAITVSLYVNDVELGSEAILFTQEGTCSRWATILTNWPPGGSQVTLEARYTFSTTVFDGTLSFAPGVYRHIVYVSVR
jgi:serine/threonine-protein kinase